MQQGPTNERGEGETKSSERFSAEIAAFEIAHSQTVDENRSCRNHAKDGVPAIQRQCFLFQPRTKEIGVRRVLGASVSSFVLMLARGYLLIGVSPVLASLVSYLVISNWLTAFAYRAEIAAWVFFAAAFFNFQFRRGKESR